MGRVEWAIWANEQAFVSCITLFFGSIIGVAFRFKRWEFAVYALIVSILLFLLEYPRCKSRRGATIERRFQKYFAFGIAKLQPFTTNYYVRFVVHLLLSIPCCLLLPTLIGAVFLMVSSMIYLVAALKGEEWVAVEIDQEPTGRVLANISEPPSRPPPRGPPIVEVTDIMHQEANVL